MSTRADSHSLHAARRAGRCDDRPARRNASFVWTWSVLLVLLCGAASPALGQERRYTLAVRGVALDRALEEFVHATGLAVSYNPLLVRGRQAYCAAEDESAEEVLRCILKASGLDFYRLSSGTYVLTEHAELTPQFGYISGTVTDRRTGAPLVDAHVYLAEARVGSLTNRGGQFVLPPLLPGRYVVRVSHVGYHTWQDTLHIAVREKVHAEAVLEPETVFITPVVVDGHAQRLASTDLGRGHVRTGQMPVGLAAASQQTYQALGALSGVQMSNVTADVHVQGGEAGGHEFRLDGVPVYLPRTTIGLIGPFSSFALGGITVEKAGFGVSQGSHAAGVILAEHAVEAKNGVDVQVDPLSVNARLQVASTRPGGMEIAFMAAGRTGLWNVHAPAGLHTMLDAWSRPDPFLMVAPVTIQADTLPPLTGTFTDVNGATRPAVAFSDLHAAARVRMGPLHTLHASVYRGASGLSGGVLSTQYSRLADAYATPPFSVADNYAWHNALGQVRYDAVLGSRTLISAQVRGSRYVLENRYRVLDSLSFSSGSAAVALNNAFTSPVEDGNEVQTAALEGVLDHARDGHHVRLGAEVNRTKSFFGLSDVRLTAFSLDGGVGQVPERSNGYIAVRQGVNNWSGGWRLAAFASDELTISPRLRAEVGVRLTYLPSRATAYPEPRLAVYYDGRSRTLGPWSARTAAGLYRQFVNQLDISKFNVGAMLPSVRIWLPVDATVRPPLAYHLSHTMHFTPGQPWRIGLEGYYKYQPHALVARYAQAGEMPTKGWLQRQALFLANARGHAYGASASVGWRSTEVQLEGMYAFSQAVQQSPALFSGRTELVPWNEPHRVELRADWMPSRHLTMSTRAYGVWGRAWGFRQVYYDYFAHSPSSRLFPPYDLSRPSDHRLPALYQFDVSAAYTWALGRGALQARFDVYNVLGRKNVADWRLVLEDGTYVKQPRYLHPRVPALALRLSF